MCNTPKNKVPPVTKYVKSCRTMETALDGPSKKLLEEHFGNALRTTAAVKSMTREFGKRVWTLAVEGGKSLYNYTEDSALAAMFPRDLCEKSTGFAGAEPNNIRDVLLKNGNIREVWGYVYCIYRNKHLSALFNGLDVEWFRKIFNGMSAEAVKYRRFQVQQTSQQLSGAAKYNQGIPDYVFPLQSSWANFDFKNRDWEAARVWPKQANTSGLWSDDSNIFPPLSSREISAACGDKDRCKLNWVPGENFEIIRTPIGNMSGYAERAAALNYRTCAGPSATTANTMMLAQLLGFGGVDLVILRATMIAWMVPAADHSFFEILLGAEPHMPAGFQMVLGWEDLEQVWPHTRAIEIPWSADSPNVTRRSFTPSEFWSAVRTWFNTNLTGSVCAQANALPLDRELWSEVLMGPWKCAHGFTVVATTTNSGANTTSACFSMRVMFQVWFVSHFLWFVWQ
jgi:hypothetical protein